MQQHRGSCWHHARRHQGESISTCRSRLPDDTPLCCNDGAKVAGSRKGTPSRQLPREITLNTSAKTLPTGSKPQSHSSPTVPMEASLSLHPLSRARASTPTSDIHPEIITPQLDADRSVSGQTTDLPKDTSEKDRFPRKPRGSVAASGAKNFPVGNYSLQSENENATDEERKHLQ